MRAALIFVSVICAVSAAKLGQNGKAKLLKTLLKKGSSKNAKAAVVEDCVLKLGSTPSFFPYDDKAFFEENGLPSKLKFWVKDNSIVGVQFEYGQGAIAPVHGAQSGDLVTFEPKAPIIWIGGAMDGDKVTYLYLIDDTGTYFDVGLAAMDNFMYVPQQCNGYLKYISGTSGSKLDQINFEFCGGIMTG